MTEGRKISIVLRKDHKGILMSIPNKCRLFSDSLSDTGEKECTHQIYVLGTQGRVKQL